MGSNGNIPAAIEPRSFIINITGYLAADGGRDLVFRAQKQGNAAEETTFATTTTTTTTMARRSERHDDARPCARATRGRVRAPRRYGARRAGKRGRRSRGTGDGGPRGPIARAGRRALAPPPRLSDPSIAVRQRVIFGVLEGLKGKGANFPGGGASFEGRLGGENASFASPAIPKACFVEPKGSDGNNREFSITERFTRKITRMMYQ